MGEIVKIAKDINPAKLERATEVHKDILVRTIVTAGNLIELGKLFKEVRDDKLYKLLGASSFSEYCAYPEIPYARTTIYSFIGIYEKYVLEFNINPKKLAQIGHWKLQLVSPVVTKYDTVAWLHKANTLSPSDLINEIRSAQGKPEMLPLPPEEKDVKYFKFNKTGWLKFVAESPCVIHKERNDTESAHVPRTKKRGGEHWEVIPLCNECHDAYHRDTYDFLYLNKYKIFKWFYELLIGGKE